MAKRLCALELMYRDGTRCVRRGDGSTRSPPPRELSQPPSRSNPSATAAADTRHLYLVGEVVPMRRRLRQQHDFCLEQLERRVSCLVSFDPR
eukprot:760947-Hanusia_phi.AAC.11